ncbi:MAG: 4-(cytidine 5'-diphospho)-2-C-methyl-D-erythritol kinase [Ruminococcaceae bacterium]|nr:4-(cytidine 5'-diphospho)-2-C-methyl-D-erythritol kinase [Oscillospiraceae bacterium]
MNKLVKHAKAKINLTLDVLGKREDGYHDLKMIMVEIPLADTVTLTKQEGISVNTNLTFLPNNEKNIAFRAAKLFFEATGIQGGVSIEIEKKIPVSAGLAGGSTDAASVFLGLNELYEANLPLEKLQKLGNTIGKDIPFCLQGGVALAEGTGECLSVLPKLPSCWIVLIKPKHINVSTKEVFTSLQASKLELHPDTQGAISALESGDLQGISRRMYNVLEEVTVKKHPLISELKSVMLEEGAMGSVMSGSGPSVFGIFDSLDNAQKAKDRLIAYDDQVFLMEV